jgi:hypothetical protein
MGTFRTATACTNLLDETSETVYQTQWRHTLEDDFVNFSFPPPLLGSFLISVTPSALSLTYISTPGSNFDRVNVLNGGVIQFYRLLMRCSVPVNRINILVSYS